MVSLKSILLDLGTNRLILSTTSHKFPAEVVLVFGFCQPPSLAGRFAGFATIFLAFDIAGGRYEQLFAITTFFPFDSCHWQSSS
jgi:hypothetical protein